MVSKNKNLAFTSCKLLIILLLITFSQIAYSQFFTGIKKIEKSFYIRPSTTLDISNKYGKIKISNWEYDSIRFSIDVIVKSQDTILVQELSKMVDFEFVETSYFLTAKTIYNTQDSKFFKDISSPLNAFQNDIGVDYNIFLPKYINLKVSNKYGDVYIDDLFGSFDLNLSNGDLKANDLKGEVSIDLGFGKGSINSVSNGLVSLTYADMQIKQVEQLNLNTKYSKIQIQSAEVLKIQSKRDKYYINKCNHLYGETNFSDIFVRNLNNEISCNAKYGSINLEAIAKSFSMINLISLNSDLNLFFKLGNSYDLEMTHKNINFTFPEKISNFKKKIIQSDLQQFKTTGYVGLPNTISKVRINAENCNVVIHHK